MERQKHKPQVKEQENSPEEKLNEMEVSNWSDLEFKIIIIRMLNSMKKDMEVLLVVDKSSTYWTSMVGKFF